jgi:hypothetical protein
VDSADGIGGGAIGRDPSCMGELAVAAASGNAKQTAGCGGAVLRRRWLRQELFKAAVVVGRQRLVPSWPGARCPKVEGRRVVRQGEG